MSISCCVCSKRNVQLYRDSLSKLVFCGTKCQFAPFIEGQTKRGREDEEELEKFEATLNILKSAEKLGDAELQKTYKGKIRSQVENALALGRIEILSLAKKYDFLNFKDAALMSMALQNFESMKFLLKNGLQKEEIDRQEILQNALDNRSDFEIIKLLVEEGGANVNEPPESEYIAPLSMAITYSVDESNLSLVQLFLDHGAEITIYVLNEAFLIIEDYINDQELEGEEALATFMQTSPIVQCLMYLLQRIPSGFDLFSVPYEGCDGLFATITSEPLRLVFMTKILSHYQLEGMPRDVSKVIVAEKLRNFLCTLISNEQVARDNLLTFARLLGVPKETIQTWRDFSKGKLCSYISSILAIGAVWNSELFNKHRLDLRSMKELQQKQVMDAVEQFKRGIAWTLGIETDGKTLEQLLQEANDIMN